jgi:hypothetical protein
VQGLEFKSVCHQKISNLKAILGCKSLLKFKKVSYILLAYNKGQAQCKHAIPKGRIEKKQEDRKKSKTKIQQGKH